MLNDVLRMRGENRKPVVMRGLTVLWRGVVQQRKAFTLSVIGSSLWAFMTVGQAYVLGRITPSTPCFRR